jgi:formate hydrogenlyase transcriptional activator
LLFDPTNSVVANLERDDLLREVTVGATRVIRSDFAMAGLLDSESGRLQIKAFDLPDNIMLDLHIFPLPVPPLRDRREDIPILVRHYVDKYARRMNRRIESIPTHAMEVFSSYPWPGNVGELQNFIERAVILSPGSILRPPLAELKQATAQAPVSKLSSLEQVEREHVLRAIRESN